MFGIRIKFFITFVICFCAVMIFSLFLNSIWRNNRNDYTHEINRFNAECSRFYEEFKNVGFDEEKIYSISINNIYNKVIFITDLKGTVVFQSSDTCITSFDIDKIKLNISKTYYYENQVSYYNIKKINDDKYIIITSLLYKSDNQELFVLGIIVFLIMFFTLTYGGIKYLKDITNGLINISNGNFYYKIKIKGNDEISLLGENINKMTEKLKALKEREKEEEKNKNMLIVSVSHDLRTPLTSVIGYIKLLQARYKNNDEIKEYINIIDEKSARLECLINDLFEYTKLSAVDMKIERQDVYINEFMRQIIEGMMPLLCEKNLKLSFNPLEEDIVVKIDPMNIMRVFENIITNAIRYSETNSTIQALIEKDMNKIIISFENSGCRINKDEEKKIFEMFYRSDKSRNNNTGGSGIGLAIAKRIVELHEGKIYAECREDIFIIKVEINI